MSDSDEFDERVAKLGQADELVGGARIVARAQDGARGVARAVLNAVDETILPAQLIFVSEAGETLTLSVAARRLRSVTAASDDLSPEDIVGQELEPEEEAGLVAALALVDRFARGASGAVAVTEQRGEENNARGVAAIRLIGMLPTDDGPEAPPADTPPADTAPADTGTADTGTADTGAADTGADRAGAGAVTAAEPAEFLAAGGDRIFASLLRSPSGEEVVQGMEDLAELLAYLADDADPDAGPAFDIWMHQAGGPEGYAFGRAVWTDGTVVTAAFGVADVAALVAAFGVSRAD